MPTKRKRTGIVLAILLVLGVLGYGGHYYFTHNLSYKNTATEGPGGAIILNGDRYDFAVDYDPHDLSMRVSDVLICKTEQGGKVYMLEGYPDYEYIAVYYAWDGTIYQRAEEETGVCKEA